MAAFTLSKVGTLFGTTHPAYYPCLIDTSAVTDWPWTVTLYSSTDHGNGGIYMYGAVGDPTNPSNWETYNAAKSAGRFDAFETKPDSNPIWDDGTECETPHIVKVGTEWLLSYHDDVGEPFDNQPTRLAIATGAPLNFSRLNNGNDGKILDGTTSPLNLCPGNPHRGYFRWGLNPFSGVPYTYVGYGLCGGTDASNNAIYGSDDGKSWTLISVLNRNVTPGLPSGVQVNWTQIDPQSIRDAGNGEYVALCPCGTAAFGSSGRTLDLYELYIAADGYTLTREPRLVLSRGDESSDDETELGQPTTLDYQGTLLCVYQGADDSSANSLMLATGSVDASAVKPDPLSRPNHDKTVYDLTNLSSLPAGVTSTGTVTFAASGTRLAHLAGLIFGSSFEPQAVGWAEIVARFTEGGGSNAVPIVSFGDIASFPNNGVGIWDNSSISGTRIASRASAATVDSHDFEYALWGTTNRRHRLGVTWDVANAVASFVGNGAQEMYRLDVPGAPTDVEVNPRISARDAILEVAEVTVRIGTSGDGVAPTVSSATADNTTVTLTLSADCIGDGTGITVNVGGSPVAGSWSRAGSTNLTFTRSSGTFSSSDTITYDVASTDVRSEADLVAIQDASDQAVVNNASGGGGGSSGGLLLLGVG